MVYGPTPFDTSSPTPIPMTAVVPDGTNQPTALEGGPIYSGDVSGNKAPASMYVKDGNDLAQGATTDTAVTGDVSGSLSAKLRGLSKIFNDIWDSVNHRIKVDGSGVTQPVSGSVSVSNLPGTQPVSGTVTANAGANLNTSALALETGGNLANTQTNTSNISTAIGATSDVAVVGDNSGSVNAHIRGLTKILNDIWDSTNHLFHLNLKQVGGNTIAVGSNAVPVLTSAATGYVSAYGSNAAALTSATDYAFKWGVVGTTAVNHVMIQNNTGSNLNYDLDVAATAGSPVLSTGQTVFFDVVTSAVHLYQAGTPNVNGTAASNIVVRGWL